MFFGAGNLIFPPFLGLISGDKWLITFIGFVITGICVPLLCVIAMGKSGGGMKQFAGQIHPIFGNIFGALVLLAIGPLLAIPRTEATIYELGIKPFFPSARPLLVSVIFFVIVVLFVINPSRIIDNIGKYLTPLLLLVLVAIIIKAVVTPIGVATSVSPKNYFLLGFEEGYQTMDALAAMVFSTFVLVTIRERGYTDKKAFLRMGFFVCIIAGLGLFFVYGGLLYAGATSRSSFDLSGTRVELLIAVCRSLWGSAGSIILASCVILACFTTAVGLMATAGKYFSDMFRQKVSYKVVVIFVALVSCWISIYGVEKIIQYAVPLLEILYPVCIFLILSNLFYDIIPNKYFYIGGTLGTLLVSLPKGFVAAVPIFNTIGQRWFDTSVSFSGLSSFLNSLPLAQVGLSWLLPALVLSLICGFFCYERK